jgi:hypothetical protein
VLGDQFMQSANSVQAFRQPGLGQPAAGLILNLDVMVVFGPVISDEQQHPQQLPISPDKRTTATGATPAT